MSTDAVTQQKNWNGKPYHSLDHMLRERFGEKVYKVTLNGGMSCPNRDGKLGSRGCIFCSAGGSGDFAADAELSVTEQIDSQIALLSAKRPIHKYIAYFQAYTNTYAPVEYLRKIFTEALAHPSVVALSIGTRPDCLGEDVLELLNELNQRKPVWIELGLQTIHERTAAYIRRGYPLSCFEETVHRLRSHGIQVIVHTILGLPGESEKDILETMQYLNGRDIQGIKLQLLHVLRRERIWQMITWPGNSVLRKRRISEFTDRLSGTSGSVNRYSQNDGRWTGEAAYCTIVGKPEAGSSESSSSRNEGS